MKLGEYKELALRYIEQIGGFEKLEIETIKKYFDYNSHGKRLISFYSVGDTATSNQEMFFPDSNGLMRDKFEIIAIEHIRKIGGIEKNRHLFKIEDLDLERFGIGLMKEITDGIIVGETY